MLKQLFVAGSLFSLSCCSSSHDMSDGKTSFWGGGFQVTKSRMGTYKIRAQTDVAPFTNMQNARAMWAEQAEKSCGAAGYLEKDIKENSYETMPPTMFGLAKYIVSVKEGVAVCKQQG